MSLIALKMALQMFDKQAETRGRKLFVVRLAGVPSLKTLSPAVRSYRYRVS